MKYKLQNLDIALNKLPKWEDIPEEYRRCYYNKHPEMLVASYWIQFVKDVFYYGLSSQYNALIALPGIDGNKEIMTIMNIMHSFAPKHEHKIAGCAYLFSQSFEYRDDKES